MNKRVFISLSVVLAGLLSCTGSGPELHPLESGVAVEMQEESDPPKGILLGLRTRGVYPCCNHSIRGDLELDPLRIAVELSGIEKPDICLAALGPAGWDIELGELENGVYFLSFSYLDERGLSMLSVTDSLLETKGPDTSLIMIETRVLHRTEGDAS